MSIAIIRRLSELEMRVEALERTVTASPRRLGVLYAQAAAMRAQGDALKAEVRAVLAALTGSRRLKAFTVRSYLRREPLPSLRRVQEVMRQIREESPDCPAASRET